VNNLLLPQVSEAIEISTSDIAKSENSLDLDPEITAMFDYYYQNIGYNQMTPEQAADAYIVELEKLLGSLKMANNK
jgi:hypothetical protein